MWACTDKEHSGLKKTTLQILSSSTMCSLPKRWLVYPHHSFSPSPSICYLGGNKTTNVRVLKVNLLSFVHVFYWGTMEQRLFIILSIFVVKWVVVVFSLVEQYKGSLLLFCIFLGFFNSCFNCDSLFCKEQLLLLILFLTITMVLGITCFCFNSHFIHAHEIIDFSVSANLKIS